MWRFSHDNTMISKVNVLYRVRPQATSLNICPTLLPGDPAAQATFVLLRLLRHHVVLLSSSVPAAATISVCNVQLTHVPTGRLHREASCTAFLVLTLPSISAHPFMFKVFMTMSMYYIYSLVYSPIV